jgi:hypothetical protein
MATQTLVSSAFSPFQFSQSPRYQAGFGNSPSAYANYRSSELIAPKPVHVPTKILNSNFSDPMFDQAADELYGILQCRPQNNNKPFNNTPPSPAPMSHFQTHTNSAFERTTFASQPININMTSTPSSGMRNLHDLLINYSSQNNSYSESFDYVMINNTPPSRSQNPITQFV